ncbi:MAG: sigma-70 family RNA polymerase sigma factor [Oscillospiraceae bacterium]
MTAWPATTEYAGSSAHLTELLAAIAAGQQDALAQLYHLTRTAVYGLSLSYLKNTHDAQDITQDVFVHVWDHAPQYRPTGSPMGWLLTVCRNLCLMRLRCTERHAVLSEAEWDAIPQQETGLTTEERTLLQHVLSRLGEEERRIVLLHAVTGLKHREIAALLELPLPTVLSKYHRAIRKCVLIWKEITPMTNEKLEQCLAQALEKTAPHDVDGVLSRCEKRKGTEIPMKTKPHSLKKWMAMAACLALLLLCGGGLFLRQANAVASVVSIDVNPSIELRVNQNEKVLACVPMNDDAHAILADMGDGEDLKGAKLDVAVNAIVGSLVRNGYLESISSAIMISVEDRDQSRAHRLQQDLSAAVDGILRDSASQASVLTQTVTQDTSLEKQAKDHHISTGKAALVNRILALNNSLSFEELSRLSIGELKDLAETGAPAMPIGMERALEIALLTCGQSADQLTKQEVDAELDEVPAHYEVELEDRSGTEYEYRIDAYTGAVLTSYVEPDGHDDVDDHDDHDDDHDDDDDDAQPTGSAQPTGQIGHAAAKAAALTHAGVSESQAYDTDVELDDEDGRWVYEVEFKADDMEYEYVIDAYTGAVLEYDMEQDD